jgi:hypothetical protein
LHPSFVTAHQNLAFGLRPTAKSETKSLSQTRAPEKFDFQFPRIEEESGPVEMQKTPSVLD